MHRRELLRTAPFLLAGSLGSHLAARAGRAETDGLSRMRLAICAYSFRTPLGSKALTYADLVHMAVEQEIDGLDLTVYWFPSMGGHQPGLGQLPAGSLWADRGLRALRRKRAGQDPG